MESLGRTIVLPKVSTVLAADAVIKRGLMNRLAYTVANTSTKAVESARLKVELGGRTHYSESFNLAAGDSTTASVVVGGYEDLIDPMDATTTTKGSGLCLTYFC